MGALMFVTVVMFPMPLPTPPPTQPVTLATNTGTPGVDDNNSPKRHNNFYKTSGSLQDAGVLRVRRHLAICNSQMILTLARLATCFTGSPDTTLCRVASFSTTPFLFPTEIRRKVVQMNMWSFFLLKVINLMYTFGSTECESLISSEGKALCLPRKHKV